MLPNGQAPNSNLAARIQAGLAVRAERVQAAGREWDEAEKPAKITGQQLKVLGAKPQPAGQLHNTTSGGNPVAARQLPGRTVGDWVPRIRQEEPEVRPRPKSPSIIVVRIIRYKTLDGLQIPYEEIGIVSGNRYRKIGSTEDLIHWRPIGPEMANEGISGMAGVTYTLEKEVGGFSASIALPASSSLNTPTISYAYSAKAVKIESATGQITVGASPQYYQGEPFSYLSLSNVPNSIFASQFIIIEAFCRDRETSDFYEFTDSNSGAWRVLAPDLESFDMYDPIGSRLLGYLSIVPPANRDTTTSISVSGASVIPGLSQPDVWTYVDQRGWIVWYAYKELNFNESIYTENAGGASYVQEVFLGFEGKGLSSRSTKVYVRRRLNDMSIVYFSGTTYEDIESVVDDPLLDPEVADFFVNSKTPRLKWEWSNPGDLGPFADPCQEASVTDDTRNYVGSKLSEYQGDFADIKSYLLGQASTVKDVRIYGTADDGGACGLSLLQTIPFRIPSVLSSENPGNVTVEAIAYFSPNMR